VIDVIIGYGEIGKALHGILSRSYKVFVKDVGPAYMLEDTEFKGAKTKFTEEEVVHQGVNVMHVCIPWDSGFCESVKAYKAALSPSCVVIHSSVPVGTSRSLGVLHSPAQGRHPFLKESMLVYTKFIGGEGGSDVADYFRRAGFSVYLTDKQESTELIKLDETTWFAVMVEKTKETKRLCEQYNVPFELFTVWTTQTNEGLKKLGQEDAVRPNLAPIAKKQGGHCTLPNARLLKSEFANFVLSLNEEGKEQ
jgi:hypothetical protein